MLCATIGITIVRLESLNNAKELSSYKNSQSPCLDDTSIDKLLDLLTNDRVLEMFLQSLRVLLCLLKDGLHDRVIHDFL